MHRCMHLVTLLLMANATLATEPVFKRWAVIAQESLRESGLSDLLAAELSGRGVELVEREQLAAVVKEIELAKLLAETLRQQRGVAVLEIEEARAIAEEQRVAGSDASERRVPLLIDGDFKASSGNAVSKRAVEPSDELRGQSLQIAVRVRDGKAERAAFTRSFERLADAREWLSSVVVKQLSNGRTPTNSLSDEQQIKLLLHRADQFAAWSAFEQSTALREAALLRAPEQWELRAQLVREYRQWMQYRSTEVLTNSVATTDERKRALLAEQLRIGVSLFRHLDWLVATAPLNPMEVAEVMSLYLEDRQAMDFRMPELAAQREDVNEVIHRWARKLPKADATQRDGFVHHFLQRGQRIEGQPKLTSQMQIDRSVSQVFGIVTQAVPGYLRFTQSKGGSAQSLPRPQLAKELKQLFPVLLGGDRFSSSVLFSMTHVASGGFPRLVNEKVLQADELEGVFNELIATDDLALQFTGRFGLVGLRRLELGTQAVDAADVTRLEADLPKLVEKIPALKVSEPFLRSLVLGTHQSLPKPNANKGTTPQPRPKSKPKPKPNSDDEWRLAFEPLSGTETPAFEVVKYGEWDLHWSRHEVAVMREKGVLQPIVRLKKRSLPLPTDDCIWQAVWCGRYIWVATRLDGIGVYELNGKLVGRLKPDAESRTAGSLPAFNPGIPPHPAVSHHANPDYSPFVVPIEPGRVFVTAEIGSDKRRWCGEISRANGGDFQFKMWLEATLTPDDDVSDQAVEAKFRPAFQLLLHAADQAAPQVLLIGREDSAFQQKVGRSAIVFDLATGKPRTLPGLILKRFDWRRHDVVQFGDEVVVANNGITRCRPLNGKLDGEWQQTDLLTFDQRSVKAEPQLDWRDQLLLHEGSILKPGAVWYRVDPQSWKVETLTPKALPPNMRFKNYAVSAHYGLVAWDSGRVLHRVHIDADISDEQRAEWKKSKP